MGQLDSGPSMMNTGLNAWSAHDQGTAFSPYPDLSYSSGFPVGQQQYGAGLSSAAGPEQNSTQQNSAGIQATPYGGGGEKSTVSGPGAHVTKSKKRKSDTATGTTDPTAPAKVKKPRGPRKKKEKSAAEKKAREEKKLERNRMAASKCRQKKKVATDDMVERHGVLERDCNLKRAYLEELKKERNIILELLLEHKNCGHLDLDKCLESQLQRITEEVPQSTEAGMLRAHSQQSHTNQTSDRPYTPKFLDSSAPSPSNEFSAMYGQLTHAMSRHNSSSSDRPIAISRQSSNVSQQVSHQKNLFKPQSWNAPQAWGQHFPVGCQVAYQPVSVQSHDLPVSQGNSAMPSQPRPLSRQGLNISLQQHLNNSPGSSSNSRGSSMSRQNSSHTSASGEHQRHDSGTSNVGTPPEDRKKGMTGSSEDEGIFLPNDHPVAHGNGFQPQFPPMMPNQRLFTYDVVDE